MNKLHGAIQIYIWELFYSNINQFLLLPWWRHQMETFSALLAICAGNSPVPGEFPTQRPVTRSFDVYFDLRPNKRLSKQSWGWWFETLSCSLWRHRNAISSSPAIIEVPDADFVCVRDTRSIVIGVSTLAGSLVLLMATILGIYKFRGEIKVMLYFKLGWRPFDQSDDTDILNKGRLFFVFDQISHKSWALKFTVLDPIFKF